MAERYEQGAWVEIQATILEPGARAPQVPDDTRMVPLEMKAKGFLVEPAALGEQVEIETVTGRRLSGRLLTVNPAYDHGFGRPVTALATIGRELRMLLNSGEGSA
jgi:hypothetical protein